MDSPSCLNPRRLLSGSILVACFAGSFCNPVARAQVSYPGGTLTQNFDSLPNSGGASPWVNNSTLAGWYAWRLGTGSAPGNVMPTTGSDAYASRVQSYGVAGNSQRSIGILPDSTNGTIQLAVRITNTTGTTLTAFSAVCDTEQWRSAATAAQALQTLKCEYSVNAISINDTGSGVQWNEIRRLAYDNTPAKVLDGQLGTGAINGRKVSVSLSTPGISKVPRPGNRATLSDIVAANFSWAPGTDLWIRWTNALQPTGAAGFAIDNFSFTASDGASAGFREMALATVRDLDHDLAAGDTAVVLTRSLPLAAWICLALDYPDAASAKTKAAAYLTQCFALQLAIGTPTDPAHGQFPWAVGENFLSDANAVDFTMQNTTALYKRYSAKLAATSAALPTVTPALQRSAIALTNHLVDIGYTNPYLMRASGLALLGELLGDTTTFATGRDAFQTWTNDVMARGIVEYGSPTYSNVQYTALLAAYNTVADAPLKSRLKNLLDYFVADLSAHFFAGRNDLAGAHSRDYDFLNGAGGIDNFYYRAGLLTPMGSGAAALPSLNSYSTGLLNYLCSSVFDTAPYDAAVSPYITLEALVPRAVKSRLGLLSGQDRTAYVASNFAIGSSSYFYGNYDKQVTADLFAGTGDFGQASFLFDKYNYPWGNDYANTVVPGYATVLSGSGKPNHLKYDNAVVQEKSYVLGLGTLRRQFTDDPNVNFWNVVSTFLFPASKASGATTGTTIQYWLVDNATGAVASVAGTQRSTVAANLGDVFGVRYGDSTLGGVIGFRYFLVDGLDGQTPALSVKFDHPTTSSTKLGRFVAYHYASDPLTVPAKKFGASGLNATPPRIGWIMAAGNALTEADATAFLQNLRIAPITQATVGNQFSASVVLGGATLSASLDNATGAVVYRRINGADVTPLILTIVPDTGVKRDIAGELLGVIEAETYASATAGTGTAAGVSWSTVADTTVNGGAYVQATPNTGVSTGSATNAPRLNYTVNLAESGTHFVWVRMTGASGTDDSVQLGLDGTMFTSAATGGINPANVFGAWVWQQNMVVAGVTQRITVNVAAAGAHTLNLWMREDGVKVDKIILTKDAAFVPN